MDAPPQPPLLRIAVSLLALLRSIATAVALVAAEPAAARSLEPGAPAGKHQRGARKAPPAAAEETRPGGGGAGSRAR